MNNYSKSLLLVLFACSFPGCSRTAQEVEPVLKSATIELMFDLRGKGRIIESPRIIEVRDPTLVRRLRDEFRAQPQESSGRKSLWTAIGSITFLDNEGETTRFLFGAFDWALTGDDNEYPLPEGFNDRLIDVIETSASKE